MTKEQLLETYYEDIRDFCTEFRKSKTSFDSFANRFIKKTIAKQEVKLKGSFVRIANTEEGEWVSDFHIIKLRGENSGAIINVDNPVGFTTKDIDVSKMGCLIHSVKRVKDGLTITVWDEIMFDSVGWKRINKILYNKETRVWSVICNHPFAGSFAKNLNSILNIKTKSDIEKLPPFKPEVWHSDDWTVCKMKEVNGKVRTSRPNDSINPSVEIVEIKRNSDKVRFKIGSLISGYSFASRPITRIQVIGGEAVIFYEIKPDMDEWSKKFCRVLLKNCKPFIKSKIPNHDGREDVNIHTPNALSM